MTCRTSLTTLASLLISYLAHSATPSEIKTLPGFKAEKIYSVKKNQGSWVGLASDPEGRLITTDQYGGIYRVTLSSEPQVEKLQTNITGAHGALCAFDSLYLFVNEGDVKKRGLYRLRDLDGDDQYESEELLIPFTGGGEHGMHSLVLSPDQKSIYLIAGNSAKIPSTVTHHRMSTKWGEDHLLPRMDDGRGHARGRLAPGGFIMKINPDATSQEIINTGFRNQFDAAFNLDGELFTFDADMEFDVGSPWYRPTRINHVVSGADWGWRHGTGKWPAYYPDTLPSVIDIGPASPTGVCSGLGSKFPAKYQKALYAADWTFGTLYAIHLEKDGASYRATKEEFLSGKPLPLSDVIIHRDGHMYFLVGGRRTSSALYRLTYTGSEATTPVTPSSPAFLHALRKKIEHLHDKTATTHDLARAIPYLGHPDRFIRHAARVAIEKQTPASWQNLLTPQSGSWSTIEHSVALARMGEKDQQAAILNRLNQLDHHSLTTDQLLATLRAYQLSFTRYGSATDKLSQSVIEKLSPLYPHHDPFVNRELAQILLYLNAPNAVSRSINLMLNATDPTGKILSDEILQRNDHYAASIKLTEQFRPNAQQFTFAFHLRSIKDGWTDADRASYFSWFPRAKTWQGGNSFSAFVENTRTEALAHITDPELRQTYDTLSNKSLLPPRAITPPTGPGQKWTVETATAAIKDKLKNRNFKSGENLFHATACASCHRFADQGSATGSGIGPDLTGSANRYTLKDMLENIIEPSKAISDQYGSSQLTLKDGSSLIGRIGSEENGSLQIMTNPFSPDSTIHIKAADIAQRKPYSTSPMPPALINALNADELADLIAYLFSAGDPKHPSFSKD